MSQTDIGFINNVKLEGIKKTDKQFWSESLKIRNNRKKDALIWWTNASICSIVYVFWTSGPTYSLNWLCPWSTLTITHTQEDTSVLFVHHIKTSFFPLFLFLNDSLQLCLSVFWDPFKLHVIDGRCHERNHASICSIVYAFWTLTLCCVIDIYQFKVSCVLSPIYPIKTNSLEKQTVIETSKSTFWQNWIWVISANNWSYLYER